MLVEALRNSLCKFVFVHLYVCVCVLVFAGGPPLMNSLTNQSKCLTVLTNMAHSSLSGPGCAGLLQKVLDKDGQSSGVPQGG